MNYISNIRHLLAIDLESFIVSKEVNDKNLNFQELRSLDKNYVINSLNFILKKLKKYDQKVTFFVVLKLEEVYPGIIKKILKNGHEVGWHTYSHATISNEKILIEELNKSNKIIKKYKIKGFQAPQIKFIKKGYSILKKKGFLYSSSIYGNSNNIHDFYGIKEIPVSTSKDKHNPIGEKINFPSDMSVKNILKFGVPYGSGYFWSILGRKYYFRKIKKCEKEGRVVNLFIHNWQLFPVNSNLKYKNYNLITLLKNPSYFPYLKNASDSFDYLLANFRFMRFDEYVMRNGG